MMNTCGPKTPFFEASLHGSQIRFCLDDREAELQSIWNDIGESESKKLKEIWTMVSDLIVMIYNLILKESLYRRAILQESIMKSENCLKEVLGPDAVQVIAPEDLPLWSRLNLNSSCLDHLDSARRGSCSWTERLTGLKELWDSIVTFWPPCSISANINKDQERTLGCLDGNESIQLDLSEQESGRKDCRVLAQGRDIVLSTSSISPFGFDIRKLSYRLKKKSRALRRHVEEASSLEQLIYKIMEKLDHITKQVQRVAPVPADSHSFYSLSSCLDAECSSSPTTVEKVFHEFKPCSLMQSPSPSSEETESADPLKSTSPDKLQRMIDLGFDINIGRGKNSSTWPSVALVASAADASHQSLLQNSKAFFCGCKGHDGFANTTSKHTVTNAPSNTSKITDKIKSVNGSDLQAKGAVGKLQHFSSCTLEFSNQTKQYLAMMTNNQLSTKPVIPSSAAGSLPPPPPPLPPPLPPPSGAKLSSLSKPTKLKRSMIMGKLYSTLKKKVEGVQCVQSGGNEVLLPHRTSLGGGDARECMAETLAEITRRSSYFRKIENDVQHHASSVLEVKALLESFETDDMEVLLKFRKRLEACLEQLSDECQVLARFEGFPFKKLESVRMAASLYSRLRSILQRIEDWQVELPATDQVKAEVEMVERTKDEDCRQLVAQNIRFSFDTVTRIKEAMVDLSSSVSALALKESKMMEASTNTRDRKSGGRHMFQVLWKAFQLSFRVYSFAGGQDERAETLACELAKEMEAYPASVFL